MAPSLASSRRMRLFAFTSFYVAQGLPIGLLTIAMPAWLGAHGAGAGELAGFIAVSTLPWGFKLLAGPIMDRFRFPSMGSRRPWVMLAQTGLLLALLALALSGADHSDILLLTWAGFGINSFAAIQDVAVDGMAIDVLPENERGRANALMAFGQVAGYSGSGALCGWSLTAYGLGPTAALLAVGVCLVLGVIVALREREGEKLLPWTAGSAQNQAHTLSVSWAEIGRNLARVMLLPTSLLMISVVLCWRVADGIFITAAPLLATQELGWTSSDYSSWYATSGMVAAVCGILLGPLIDRHGARLFLTLGLLGQVVAYLALALSREWWMLGWVWITGLFAINMMGQVAFIAVISLHMNICWTRVAATQFAVYMAWANLARSLGAGAYGELSPVLATGQEVLVMAGLALVAAVLIIPLNLERHRKRLALLKAGTGQEEGALVDIPARF